MAHFSIGERVVVRDSIDDFLEKGVSGEVQEVRGEDVCVDFCNYNIGGVEFGAVLPAAALIPITPQEKSSGK
jgi:hypothetical protein